MSQTRATPGVETPSSADESASTRRWTSERAAMVVFVACLVVAGFVLARVGSYRWFLGDEWEFLADREIGDLRDWFRHHGGHWVTGPVLVYRALFNVFGLNYVGYQSVIIGLHLATVCMLRVVMRRAGVCPWMATIAAASLLLFGSGEDDILWAFQIAFVGALALGLVQLVLLDHDGPIEPRDWLGLVAGVLSVMFSGVGLAMVAAVGVASLVRRGWRTAAFHVLPPLGAFITWWLIVRPPPVIADPDGSIPARAGDVFMWDVTGIRSAFGDFGYLPGVGAALGCVLVAGLVLAWAPISADERRRRAAVPGALLVGSIVFLTLTGWTRAVLGTDQAGASRYVYVVMACVLPALAVAADAFARRWRWTLIPLALLFLVGVPGNVGRFGEHFPWVEGYFARSRQMILSLPRMPEAPIVDQDLEPGQYEAGLRIGWLRTLAEDGRLPEPDEPIPPTLANELRTRLSLRQTRDEVDGDCVDLTRPIDVEVDSGDTFGIREQPVRIEQVRDGKQVPGSGVVYNPDFGETLTVQVDDLVLRITGLDPSASLRFVAPSDRPAQLCR